MQTVYILGVKVICNTASTGVISWALSTVITPVTRACSVRAEEMLKEV